MANKFSVSYIMNRNGKNFIYKIINKNVIENFILTRKQYDRFQIYLGYISKDKDRLWNAKKADSELLQAIKNGESIDKMANRLMRVTDMNRNSAIRNARTIITSAENSGRIDSMQELECQGVIIEKEWSATYDRKTRDAHQHLDGQKVEVNEPFKSILGDIMYPGDMSANPANVYNCRCTMYQNVIGFEPSENYNVYVYDKEETGKNYYIDKKFSTYEVNTYDNKTIYLDIPLEYGGFDKGLDEETRKKIQYFEYKYLSKGGGLEWGMSIERDKENFAQGDRIEVSIKPGDIVTHIHPRRDGILGGNFSIADMEFFTNYDNIKTFRAVAKEGTYSITKGENFDAEKFRNAFIESENSLREQTFSSTNNLFISSHNWLIQNAKKYGYTYSLEARGS